MDSEALCGSSFLLFSFQLSAKYGFALFRVRLFSLHRCVVAVDLFSVLRISLKEEDDDDDDE